MANHNRANLHVEVLLLDQCDPTKKMYHVLFLWDREE